MYDFIHASFTRFYASSFIHTKPSYILKKNTSVNINSYASSTISYLNDKIKTVSSTSYENLNEFSKIFNKYIQQAKSNNVQLSNKAISTNSKVNSSQILNLREKDVDNRLHFNYLNSNDPNVHERILNLCNSIEKASSYLIKSNLISDLFKILYESDSNVRHLIEKKQKNIIPILLKLRNEAFVKQEKRLYGNINECLSLLGHVESHSFKGVNILSLDGGGQSIN